MKVSIKYCDRVNVFTASKDNTVIINFLFLKFSNAIFEVSNSLIPKRFVSFAFTRSQYTTRFVT